MTNVAMLSVAAPAVVAVGSAAIVGAIAGWHRLVDWADAHTQHPGVAPLGGRHRLAIEAAPAPAATTFRRPIAAISARPHLPQVCPLDACPLDLGELEPARLYDALAGSTR
ncbi:hypothetical protein ACIA7R_31490 [Micromonospora chalcea]